MSFEKLQYVTIRGDAARVLNTHPDLWPVYGVISMYYNADQESAWPSKQRLADDLGISVPTITRRLRRLEELGLIVTQPRYDKNGAQTSNGYHLRYGGGITSDMPPVSPVIPKQEPIEQLPLEQESPPIPPQPGPKKKSPTNLPDDFWPNEASQGCMVRNGLHVSEATKSAAVEVFRDMIANAKNPTAKDWQARFRTYCAIENFQRAVHARSGNEADQRRGNGRDPRGRGIIDAYRATEEAIRDGSIAECSVLGNSHRLRRSDYEP